MGESPPGDGGGSATSGGWPLPVRRWQLEGDEPEGARELADELGLHRLTAAVLVRRGFGTREEAERFLTPDLSQLHSPFAFAQMEVAVERLLAALRRGERIVIHGDYDVDGVCGTVLLMTVLRALGGDVDFLVPHRIRDGYGLRPAGVERAAEGGADVVVAVDCGVTAHAAAERARELGIDLIVADHHEPDPTLPPTLALLNPRLPDCGYPEDNMAAVGVAFKLARGLLRRHDDDLAGTSLTKLVALGTVADLVPLVGENRVMTRHGLDTLGEAVNPGLVALLEVAGLSRGRVTAGDVAFRIAPRINAVGRMGDAADAVELFLASDPGRARRLAAVLHRTNRERQGVQERVLQEALRQPPGEDDDFVVVAGEGWHRGVIGIVASRLVEEWGRPAAAVSLDDGIGHGSARSVPGFDLVAGLARADEILDEYGGHREAAGFRLAAGRLEELREALSEAAREAIEAPGPPALTCDAELGIDDVTVPLALELERLGPFGVGNRRPRFVLRDVGLGGEPELLKDRHLRLRIAGAESELEAIAWRRGEAAEALSAASRIDAVAKIRARHWRGRLRAQLELVDLRPGSLPVPR